ncbi:unnamed protein product [Rhizoctonia solani]|uniref:Uncharacterized protein n=1 Tax=Rhizoctonia solani TaxID=456999 RepID=A0A8H3CLV7_9AGAM|nr:unnamed protein product [Rhizoctonia solani]CAE6490775.1 unnamed protein product [Rhizoctonia solani]
MSTGDSSITTPCPIPTSKPIPEGSSESLPPWTLQAEAWWILPAIPMPWQAKELPKGALDIQEGDTFQELQASYQGGLGTIQLIRYHSSPVGPYDELLYVPGQMNYKVGDSTVSGNIPKHLARFEFTPETPSDPLSPTLASVYASLSDSPNPEFSPDPIFRARLVPSRRLPNFPLNLSSIPRAILDSRVLQPPLTSPVGTEQWCMVAPGYAGQARIMYPEPGLEGARYGDGVGFPDFQSMSIGLWWPKAEIFFPAPEILDLTSNESKKTK